MNYEQKYKKALKVIEGLYNVVKYQSSSDALLTYQTIEKAFPELKESEDERIRKDIIRYITKTSPAMGENIENMVAWLEKQGERKPTDKVEPKFKVGDIVRHKNGDTVAITGINEENHCYYYKAYDGAATIHSDFSFGEECNWELDSTWFEKQREKKPTHKIEPFEAEHGKYYYCIKDYFYGGKKQASKGDVVQALRGLPIMGLKDASEYFLPVNFIKCNSAWSEEDEKFLNYAISLTDDAQIKNFLESLKGRVQPQPKQEWSSDDLLNCNRIIDILQDCDQTELIDWLESIEPNHWKPTKEQLEGM